MLLHCPDHGNSPGDTFLDGLVGIFFVWSAAARRRSGGEGQCARRAAKCEFANTTATLASRFAPA
eukprot:3313051-Pyramimonas_sp.AAC.1